MALAFPRTPRVEWYLNGWHDLTADVRQKPGISITQGRKDWATKLSPARCTFTLDDGPDHGDGDYHPENPLGQWFELLDRNTPVRVALPAAEDTFGRTVANGWGATPGGDTWSNAGGSGGTVQNSDWAVSGGVGTHSVPAAPGYRYSVLTGVSLRDVTVTATTTVAIGNITLGALEPGNLIVRRSGGTYYLARVTIDTAEVLTISIHHSVDGQLVAPVTVPGLVSIASPKTIRVKLQAEGETLRAKVYAPGAEPLGWHVEVDDTRILTAGQVGIRNGVAVNNSNTKPIVFSVDDFTVESQRFFGEVAKMVPLTSTDHVDRRTTVECTAYRRRLGDQALHTALRRYLTGGGTPFGTAEFWPLDEPAETDVHGENVYPGGGARPDFRRVGTGAIKWGIDTGQLALPRAVELSFGGYLFFQTHYSKYNGTNGYGLVWMQRLGSDSIASATLDLHDDTQLFLKIQTGLMTLTWAPSLTVLMANVPVPELGDDNAWHVVALGCRQSGGNILFDLSIDDTNYEVSQAGTAGLPRWLRLDAWNAAMNYTFQVGQVIAITNGLFTGGSGWHISHLNEAYRGYPGERAATRFTRLCAEEGVSSMLTGDPALTPTMGPQRPLPFKTLVDECVDVVMGSPFDPRGINGLGLRTPHSVIDAPVAVTLDYSAKTVAPVFGPTRDDQGTLNDVTAKRPNGGTYRYEQITGPMNVAEPGTLPGAVGRKPADVTVNVQYDTQLPDQASWRVHMGTIPGPRYPTVTVDLATDALAGNTSLTAAVLDAGIDDKLTVTDAQAARIYDDVRLIVRGYTETFDTAYQHKIVFNTTPAAPYAGMLLDDGSRLDSDTSTVATDFDAGTDTSLSVATTGGTLWTTSGAEFPFHIKAGGVVLNATACAGAGSPQAFTVDATPVNGVSKTIPAGTQMSLADPVYLAP